MSCCGATSRSCKAEHLFKLRAVGVFAGRLVREGLVKRNALKLALCLLVDR